MKSILPKSGNWYFFPFLPFRTFLTEQICDFRRNLSCFTHSIALAVHLPRQILRGLRQFSRPKKWCPPFEFEICQQSFFFFKLRGNFRVSIWSTARHALSRLHDYIPPQRFSVQFCAPIFMKLNMRLKFQKRRFFGMNSSPSSLSFPDWRTCQMQNNLHSASLFLSPFNDSTLGWTGYRSTRCWRNRFCTAYAAAIASDDDKTFERLWLS